MFGTDCARGEQNSQKNQKGTHSITQLNSQRRTAIKSHISIWDRERDYTPGNTMYWNWWEKPLGPFSDYLKQGTFPLPLCFIKTGTISDWALHKQNFIGIIPNDCNEYPYMHNSTRTVRIACCKIYLQQAFIYVGICKGIFLVIGEGQNYSRCHTMKGKQERDKKEDWEGGEKVLRESSNLWEKGG